MAESETISTTSPPPHTESDDSAALSKMEEIPKDVNQQKDSEEGEKKPGGFSLRIWPPTQKTRDAVVNRLIETLSSESILSKRYGTLPTEEALAVAKTIEEEAYGVASAAVLGDDDGIEILQAYSKEISKRMLDSVKAQTADGTGLAAEPGEDGKDEEAPADSVQLEA